MTYSISKGTKKKPIKAVVYGPEGVGKTTFASKWPKAVFIDVEDGSGHYDVARLPFPQTWNELLDEIVWCSMSNDVGTVVVDTADKAETLCKAYILERDNKESIESYGYGKGYTILAEEYKKLFECLDACVENSKNVLVVGHAQIKKFEQPDEMPFDFSEIAEKIPAFATGGIVEEPVIAKPEPESEQAAVKVSDGVDDNVINDVKFEDVTPPEIRQLHAFMKRDGITQEQVQRAVGEGKNNPYSTDTTIGEYDIGFVRDVLVAHWTQIAEGIKAQAEYEAPVPFD